MSIKSLLATAFLTASTPVFANFQVESLNCNLVAGQRPQPDVTVTKIAVFIEMVGGRNKDATLLFDLSARNRVSRIVLPAIADIDMGVAMKIEGKGDSHQSPVLTVDMGGRSSNEAKATWGTSAGGTWNYTCKIFNK